MRKMLLSIAETGRVKGLTAICAAAVIMVAIMTGDVFAASNIGNQYIGEAKAKSIALEHSGIAEDQATFIKTSLDRENGRVVYDVEFFSGSTEYDYEIDAVSGKILEYDHEIEQKSNQNRTFGKSASKNTSSRAEDKSAVQEPKVSKRTSDRTAAANQEYIGEAKAKSIALSAAGLSESDVGRIKIKLEREDGRMVYEIEFRNGRTEYEYEIDALTGDILKTDVDIDD